MFRELRGALEDTCFRVNAMPRWCFARGAAGVRVLWTDCMRFGVGLSAMRVSNPQCPDRLLLLSALAIALLSLLGAAGESLGYDRWLKVNTAKYCTHSLFCQGLIEHIPNWSDDRVRPLMEKFSEALMEQRMFKEVFGVI